MAKIFQANISITDEEHSRLLDLAAKFLGSGLCVISTEIVIMTLAGIRDLEVLLLEMQARLDAKNAPKQ